ncbi:VQ motif-containing protein 4-like [Lotus japonicus]|uniref:VQ motif-containing protein 4-like n=1 Tax=Lotus japonicus TaxID=34305 RepID=UPI00258735A9|nr:VQ motif-containing protein 4-like [Lotus japonicus]
MEISSRVQDRENQTFMKSPRSNLRNSSNNGIQIPTPPHTPNNIPRSDSNPYPTTYVQADTSSFKQVVQMLTGSSDTTKPAPCSKLHLQDPVPSSRNFNIPPMKTAPKKQQQQGFKLYERRNYNNSLKNTLIINTFMKPNSAEICRFSPSSSEILSPSLLDFPSLALSPVTPLNDDPFDKSSPSLGSSSEEEKAIADKGFYLHPSPMSTPRGFEPQLLPLFPVTSPRVTESPS